MVQLNSSLGVASLHAHSNSTSSENKNNKTFSKTQALTKNTGCKNKAKLA
jgi:hypothetical protein